MEHKSFEVRRLKKSECEALLAYGLLLCFMLFLGHANKHIRINSE